MFGGFEKVVFVSVCIGVFVGGFFEWKEGYGLEVDEEFEDEEFYIEFEGGVFQEFLSGVEVKEFKF